MDDLLTSEKEEKITNATYTISFCHKTDENKNFLLEGISEDGAVFCETRTEKQWNATLAEMAKKMKKKKIIKIRIAGEAADQQKYIKDLPLSKELFSKILDCIDFNRQILIVENTTCFSAGHLMPSDKLLQKDGKYSRYDPSPIDDDDKIVNLCKKKLQNNRQCFYYGAIDPSCAEYYEIHFIEKHSSSIDYERIVLRPKYILDRSAEQRYIDLLYQDLSNLKTNLNTKMNQIQQDNNNTPPNKVNNYTNPVSPQPQPYQQNTYGMPQTMRQQDQNGSNQYNININSGATNSEGGNLTGKNNETVFCDLKSGICCGYKLCQP